jgi:cell wall-associated NlpC family hydrolase
MWGAAGAGGLAGLVLALVFGGSTARADQLAARRAEADRVQAQLDALNRKLDRAVEAYDRATQQLADTTTAMRQTQLALRTAEHNLQTSEGALGVQVATEFRTGGIDPYQVLLSATSLSGVLEGVDLLRRTSARTQQIVEQIDAERQAISTHEAALAQERTHQRREVADRAASRRAIEANLQERRRRLASVQADIRTILAARAAAARAAAAAAAARARAAAKKAAAQAAAQAPSDPGLGGSAAGAGATSTGGSAPPPPISPPPASNAASRAADAALTQLGVRYQWGGASPSTGFDCSGLVMWAYAQVGISLPHYTGAQRAAGTPVSRSQLARGDLVFFNGDDHVGIYLGNGEFVHAPHTGDVVRISSLAGFPGFSGAVRIV